MSLSSYKTSGSIAVSDMDRAGEFHEGKLVPSSMTEHKVGTREEWLAAHKEDR